MALASFLAGILPLSFSLSQSQLRLISMVGMGVLVGTSLIVIIPEGVETLYRSSSPARAQPHKRDLAQGHTGHLPWPAPRTPPLTWRLDARADPYDMPGPVVPESFPQPQTPRPGHISTQAKEESGETHDDHSSSPHAWVGIALIAGFITMYLIDKLPQYTSPSQSKLPTHHIALNNLGRRFNLTTSLDRDEEQDSFIEQTQTTESRNRGFATTTGLVIHAAADGIALGASSSTSNNDLSLIIFFAIMVHKAPAAFGLTSILLKQGLSKRAARGHLLLFSLAAPVGAISTWVLAQLIGGYRGRSAESTSFWTGILLLFSGGTFLYVAMHSMQEASGSHHEPRMNGTANGYVEGARDGPPPEPKRSVKDLAAACFGMILPLFLQIGHAH